MAVKNLQLVKGDTLAFGLELVDFEPDIDTAYFTCKSTPDAQNNAFQKSLGNGIEKVDTGLYNIRVAPSDTSNLQAGLYYYDFQIGIGSDIYTLLIGTLDLVQDIT